MAEIEMPWTPRSRQQEGMLSEKALAKKRGARLHPRSGAGSIKDDMSTETEVIEAKDAKSSHTLKGSDLDKLFRRATRQGKEAVYIVYFGNDDITAEIHLKRGKQ